jgi:phthalate 4,5-dioxygenase
VEVVDAWHGFRGVGLRTTPNGHTHARLYQYAIPYTGGGGLWVVPMDDEQTLTFSIVTPNSKRRNDLVVNRRRELDFPGWPYAEDGVPRNQQNDWLIDREVQKNGTIYAGIAGSFNNQDIMATQTAFKDRSREHLGVLDRKIIRMRRILIEAAKNLANGIEPPALDPALPYDKIGSSGRSCYRARTGRFWDRSMIHTSTRTRRRPMQPMKARKG